MTDATIPTMTAIPERECWQLLAGAAVGRIGLLVGGRPEVLPVNYVLDGESVLFRTAQNSVLAGTAGQVVAFEVDDSVPATREGWSVLVQAVVEDVSDTVDANSERMRQLSLETWAPGRRHQWLHLRPVRVTGRRLRVEPDAL